MTVAAPPRERPIIFQPEMVRAILAGVKVETRRIVKPQPKYVPHDGRLAFGDRYAHDAFDRKRGIRPPYEEGDVLYVRESFGVGAILRSSPLDVHFSYDGKLGDGLPPTPEQEPDHPGWRIIYRADDPEWTGRWRPSIHMPRGASRLYLNVTGIRVERLDEIDDEGALREGVAGTPTVDTDIDGDWYPGRPRARFRELWDSIHGPGAFGENPYVWVISFAPRDGAG